MLNSSFSAVLLLLPFDLPSLRFTPLRYRIHGVGDWSGHIPFAADLISGLRPSVFVELGTHLGESYFAFCQAIAENGTGTQAYAVDTWHGDVHTGAYGEEVFREVDAHNREHYAEFSHLLRLSFDDAASRFEDGSIDLLHIDGTHTYEAVRHDFDTWWPKLKPGGIVLLHDSVVRHSDFGVWKVMEELRASYTSAEFLHSNGLGVVLKSDAAPVDEVLTLLLSGDPQAVERVRKYYEVCAGYLEDRFWSERRKHPADWDITSQLFWRGDGEAFIEERSVRLAHTVTSQPSEIRLTIPPLPSPAAELQLLLTHSRASVKVHQFSALDANNEILWTAAPAVEIENPCVPFSLAIPDPKLKALLRGGYIAVTISGLDPLATKAAPPPAPNTSDEPKQAVPKPRRWIFPSFLAVLALLCLLHALYFALARRSLFTASDEADYMRGALSIANGLRSGTWMGLWAGYRDALGFKAPLVCVPGGVLLLFTKSLILPFCIELLLTFAALGIACYSLFRNAFGAFQAAIASLLLLCTPLVTGLTSNYYVELLVLLLTVLALDVLIRFSWTRFTTALLFGVVTGLGLLTKATFVLFVAIPALYCLWIDFRAASRRERLRAVVHVILSAVIALALIWPWYAANLHAVVNHARASASAMYYYYPHWILADLSAGPSIFITALALIGLCVLIKRRFAPTRFWAVILLTAVTTAIGLAATVNKSTRFQVTWLPAFAALAVSVWCPPRKQTWRRAGLLASFGITLLIALQNSFDILPIRPLRFGDLQLLNSAYPLNAPQCFNDNHSVDAREYGLKETERRIAADAAVRFPKGYSAEARTTQSDLLFDHYYFDYLSSAQRHPVHYMTWWQHTAITGPQAADYLVYTRGFEQSYPGTENFDFYPRVSEDVAEGKIPYRPLFEIAGPAGSSIIVVARVP